MFDVAEKLQVAGLIKLSHLYLSRPEEVHKSSHYSPFYVLLLIIISEVVMEC